MNEISTVSLSQYSLLFYPNLSSLFWSLLFSPLSILLSPGHLAFYMSHRPDNLVPEQAETGEIPSSATKLAKNKEML